MTDRLDDAIDRAVREMLDAEPRADLGARAMAQLPSSGFRFPAAGWVLGSIAAAAIVVLAVFVAHRAEPGAPQAPAVARAVDRRLPAEIARAGEGPATAIGAPPHQVAVHRRPAVTAVPRAPRPDAVVAAAFAADDTATTTIDPLKKIAPISVAPVAQERIAPADITLRPLHTIAEIQIAPLTPSDRR